MDQFDRHLRQEAAHMAAQREPRGFGLPLRKRGSIGLGLVVVAVLIVAALVIGQPASDGADPLCADIRVAAPDGRGVTSAELEQTRSIIESRLRATGVAEPIIASEAPDHIEITLPGVAPESEEASHVLGLVSTVGALEFRPVPFELAGESLNDQPLPEAMRDTVPIVDGSGLVAVTVGEDPETTEPVVGLEFDEATAAAFDAHAIDHFGEQFAIVIDGVIEVAPSINATHYDGHAHIGGDLTLEEAHFLVALLRFGALPLEIAEVEARACDGVPAG